MTRLSITVYEQRECITTAEQPARGRATGAEEWGKRTGLSCTWSSLSPRSAIFVVLLRVFPTASLVWAESLRFVDFIRRALEEEPREEDKDRRVQTCDDVEQRPW